MLKNFLSMAVAFFVTGAMATVEIGNATLPTDALGVLNNDGDGNLSWGASAASSIIDGTIVNVDVNASAAIAATKIHDGTVDNTEFGYLNGVTSAIQTQFGTKVTGPASATDEAFCRYDATTGKLVQNSVVTATDTGAVAGVTDLSLTGVLKVDALTVYDNPGTEQAFIGPRPGVPGALGLASKNWSVGYNALQNLVDGTNNTALGWKAGSGCVNCSAWTFVGYDSGHGSVNSSSGVAIGVEALYNMGANDSVGVGRAAGYNATGARLTAIGRSAAVNVTSGTDNTAVGYQSCLTLDTGSNNSCLGVNTTLAAGSAAVIALGSGSTASGSNELVAGSSSYPVNDVYFGKGETNATATTATIHGTGGSGSNNAGGGLTLAGGLPTGSGTGGSVLIQTAPAAGSSSTPGTLATRVTVNSAGGVIIADTGSNSGNVPHNFDTVATSTTNTSATCSVSCDAGERLITGGCTNSDTSLGIDASYPSSTTAWSCGYVLGTGNCTAHAICADY